MARKKKNDLVFRKDEPVAVIDEAATIEEKEEPETVTVQFCGKEYTVTQVAGNTVRISDGEKEICVAKAEIEPTSAVGKKLFKGLAAGEMQSKLGPLNGPQ